MTDHVNIQDLLVIGLALEIVGAVLLARGILSSPREMWMRGGTYWGHSGHAVVAEWANRWILRCIATVIGCEQRWASETGRFLVRLGQAAGFSSEPDEAPADYVRRIFAVQLPEDIEIELDDWPMQEPNRKARSE